MSTSIIIHTNSKSEVFSLKKADFACRYKEIESPFDLLPPPPYKLIGRHGIYSMTVIRFHDMYNGSRLSWIGTLWKFVAENNTEKFDALNFPLKNNIKDDST